MTDVNVTRLRRGIGYVIQDAGLFPHFTVERNIGLVPKHRTLAQGTRYAQERTN